MLETANRAFYDQDMELFRDQVRKFFAQHLTPNLDPWEDEGVVDRDFWRACGEAGILCPQVPAEYGGLGLDYRYNAIIGEELSYAGSSAGITLQSDIVVDYIINYGSDEQKKKWLPGMVSGEVITAIAMTEPGAGSDLAGMRTTAEDRGDHFLLNGSKTYISNGINSDVVIVAAKLAGAEKKHAMVLLIVERGMEGFERGRNLKRWECRRRTPPSCSSTM